MPDEWDRQRWMAAFERAVTDPLPRPGATGRAASVDEWLAAFWRRAAPDRTTAPDAESGHPPPSPPHDVLVDDEPGEPRDTIGDVQPAPPARNPSAAGPALRHRTAGEVDE